MGARETGSESVPGGTNLLLAPSERDRLVAAMAAVCAERGYRVVTIADVLSRSGVGRAEFDRHFTGKADCALAAVDEILAETTRAVAGAGPPEVADWRFLLGATLALLELMAARPSYARLACIEARSSMPAEAYQRYAAGIRVIVAMLDRIRAYAAPGAPASAGRAAVGGAEFLIRRELAAGRAEELPKLLPDIVYGTVVPFLDQHEALHYAELAREMINDGG